MYVVFGPHVSKVVISIGGVRWIDGNRFSEQVSCLVKETGLFGGGAVVKVKSGICDFGTLQFRFVERFFKGGDRFLRMFRLALSDREVIGDFRGLRKVLARFIKNFHRALALF